MVPTLPNLRYERKFVADGFSQPEVLGLVRRHPAGFRETYPPRVVDNIYLDSPGRRDYYDHINGALNRVKTRVRWYGLQGGPIERPMLERKLKRGLVSGKETHPLPPISLNGTSLQPLLETTFEKADFPEILRSVLKLMEPALFNRYRRHYFASFDGKFRLTVDSDLEFADVHSGNGSVVSRWLPNPTVIVELKYAPEYADQAGTVTDALPFRMTRFSKYILGIQRTEVR